MYLCAKYGFGAARTLAKGAVTGDTPAHQKAGKIVLYTGEALDALGNVEDWPLAQVDIRHGPWLMQYFTDLYAAKISERFLLVYFLAVFEMRERTHCKCYICSMIP